MARDPTRRFLCSTRRRCETGSNLIDLLLDAEEDVDATAADELVTPLHLAVQYGAEAAVGALLGAHAYVHVATVKGTTPLILACKWCAEGIIRRLVAGGSDVNAAQVDGSTALLVCVELECAAGVGPLLDAGADVQKAMHTGFTPLHMAA